MSTAGRTVVFLPCREGSDRVERKNTRPFAGYERGLLELKLDQLERVKVDGAVLVDSDDPVALDHARERSTKWSGSLSLEVRERPEELGRSDTTTDRLIRYALDSVECETLVWTHVTSPLFAASWYERAIDAYRERDPGEHDSLMGVTPLRTFIWGEAGPLNYDRSGIRWPRTQDLEPVFEVNSSIFVVERELGRQVEDRVGRRPLLFEVPHHRALDVDWMEDFRLAEAAYRELVAGEGER